MTAQFRNLVFEGGGAKGIEYIGAMQVLAQRKLLEHVRRSFTVAKDRVGVFVVGYELKRRSRSEGRRDNSPAVRAKD